MAREVRIEAGSEAGSEAVPEAGVEFVLFDLGGVLIEPGGVGPLRELSGIGSDEELWSRWLGCRWVRAFEAGRCTSQQFAAGVVADWGLALHPAAFLEEFAGWAGPPYPGAEELVAAVGAAVPIGCLSNTNTFQWEAHYEHGFVAASFPDEHRFLSFDLGMVKPDAEIFEAVAARLPVSPQHVLFLDDNAANAAAATAVGYHARLVRGVDEARHALAVVGVLAS